MQKKILIAEDERDIRVALVAWLEDEGFEVAEASNGLDGLATFRKFKPDLVLLDVNLPGMSGVDLCRAMRIASPIPLVMFTASDDLELVETAIANGATDFVLKHSGFDELIDRINSHLELQRSTLPNSERRPVVSPHLLGAPDSKINQTEQTLEIEMLGKPHEVVRPNDHDLWNWGGAYFGRCEGEDLWTYSGRHAGRIRRNEIFRPDGVYMGELKESRLIVDWHKTARRASSFTPSSNRARTARLGHRAPFDMLIGFKDFPSASRI